MYVLLVAKRMILRDECPMLFVYHHLSTNLLHPYFCSHMRDEGAQERFYLSGHCCSEVVPKNTNACTLCSENDCRLRNNRSNQCFDVVFMSFGNVVHSHFGMSSRSYKMNPLQRHELNCIDRLFLRGIKK